MTPMTGFPKINMKTKIELAHSSLTVTVDWDVHQRQTSHIKSGRI